MENINKDNVETKKRNKVIITVVIDDCKECPHSVMSARVCKILSDILALITLDYFCPNFSNKKEIFDQTVI